ncbi:MAG TPA: HPr(Ser) kinase/phosphatase [Burkholderiales bacterium]|nr:HPr(Ser) kinase/phosphatase [Burkholderiales bacterium]
MLQTSVARLYESNKDKLTLTWLAGETGGEALILQDAKESGAFVGHLNLIHPNRIQVLGRHEQAHFDALETKRVRDLIDNVLDARPAIILLSDGMPADPTLLEAAQMRGVALFSSPLPAAFLIDKLHRYLAKTLAETTTRHGVFMDVLGLGVMITGDSGVGKSELGLELISRGAGLVADDVVEISRIAATTLVGRSPPMLRNFLEVRGLGVLNIRAIFGETAVRPKMNLRLIVHLARPNQPGGTAVERLPLHEQSEDILGVSVRKMVVPVAAGRNLAVLLEAAVRNYILQLRGYNSTEEFMERQRIAIKEGD